MSKIFEAIDRGDHGLVWQLVQSKQELQAIDEVTGLTPLALAAELGRTETVRTLLEAGVNVDRGGLSSPLESAVAEGYIEVVKLLLDAGADVNQRVAEGYTPLMTAAYLGDVEIGRALLTAGAQPRARNDAGESAIELALDVGLEDFSRELRDFSRRAFEADQRRQEEERRRQEEEERERRRAERRARIVAARASRPIEPPRPPRTPSAPPSPSPSQMPDLDRVRTPADASAAFDAIFGQGDAAPAPVDPMAYQGIERFAILLRTAPVRARRMVAFDEIKGDERTERGETPLMLAAMAGEADVCRALVDLGVEVDLADGSENQETALLKAVQTPSRGRQEAIEVLVDAGAELERRHGPSGRTPLIFAAQADVYNPDPHARSFADTTRHLIKLGARLDTEDAQGDTLLKIIKRAALGAPTTSPFRRRLFDMLKVVEAATSAPDGK